MSWDGRRGHAGQASWELPPWQPFCSAPLPSAAAGVSSSKQVVVPGLQEERGGWRGGGVRASGPSRTLCDPEQVTELLQASVPEFIKWGHTFREWV